MMFEFDKYFMPSECYLNIEVNSFMELIQNFDKIFVKKNFVNENWKKSILLREQNYPTGLKMETDCIAIPHTYSEFVNISLIVPVILKRKIDFVHMGGNSEDIIQVDVIFFLLIKESHQQVDVLRKILKLCNEDNFIREVKLAKNSQKLYDIIIKNLNNGGN